MFHRQPLADVATDDVEGLLAWATTPRHLTDLPVRADHPADVLSDLLAPGEAPDLQLGLGTVIGMHDVQIRLCLHHRTRPAELLLPRVVEVLEQAVEACSGQ